MAVELTTENTTINLIKNGIRSRWVVLTSRRNNLEARLRTRLVLIYDLFSLLKHS